MSKGADLAIRIGAVYTGAKAFAKADASVKGLTSNVKKLGAGLGVTFGAAILGRYSKDAVKAFAADDKAAQMLTKSLENLGLGFQSANVANFISDLEKTYAVADDLLRPAFQKLLTTTGSVVESQKLLQTALNLSAASGSEVTSVADDLSKAFVGQTRALAKYGLGLTQAELKAMSFEDVQKKINTLFAGQAQLAVNSYSGSIDKLSVAAGNAQEIIGEGLIQAIGKIGGGGTEGIDNVTKSMTGLATAGSAVINTFADVFQAIFNPVQYLKDGMNEFRAFGVDSAEAARGLAMQRFYDQKKITDATAKSEKERLRLLAVAAAKEKAAAAKLAKDKKNALTLNKAATMFDMDKIQIIAALKGKISDDDRKRLELQLAIETENYDKASQLTYELAKSQGLTESLARTLASLPAAKNPFASWEAYLDSIAEKARKIANMPVDTGAGAGAGVTSAIPSFADSTKVLLEAQAAELEALRVLNLLGIGNRPEMIAPASSEQRSFQSLSAAPIVIQIDGKTIATALQNESLSGVNPTVNRFAFGGFGY